ncbi:MULTISPECIES: hypothetical protein [Exiguobacterium]|uniref:hypothetical protein n=1 Tax=Exiguobacterium TaxID=33986 RepID=UPI000681EAAD|nr:MULTISPECIES: hypothetical protein [Exiguobacterium]ASI36873.1 hypothetical protein A0126_15160 [Exiguobacterium sp. N4-1P]ASI37646.1 hypothetical protein A0126_18840 [Exiguobacterium sp. N4-1P]KNH32443.1 hypothetical protein ACS74_14170 [Exiguobacterium acetylicum]RDB31906.1 hypothetical protein DVG79_15770 [Exiguobacterium sp. RIT594]
MSKRMNEDLLKNTSRTGKRSPLLPQTTQRHTVQVPRELHRRLRQIAFDKEISMAKVIEEALDKAGQ